MLDFIVEFCEYVSFFESESVFSRIRLAIPNKSVRPQEQQIPEIDTVPFVRVCRPDRMRVDEVDVSAEYRDTNQQREDNENVEVPE